MNDQDRENMITANLKLAYRVSNLQKTRTPWIDFDSLDQEAVIGLIMAVRASRQFSDAGTNIIPLTKSTALVTDGMFRWTRNPMYTGMILFLGGLALVLDNLWNWLIVIVFAVVIRQLFIRREEQLMLETFGDDYADYTRQVRRWL